MPNCLIFYSWVISKGPMSKQVQHWRPSAERCSTREASTPSSSWLALGEPLSAASVLPVVLCSPCCWAQRVQALEWVVVIWLWPLSLLASVSCHKCIRHLRDYLPDALYIVWCTCQVLWSFETLICVRLRACGCLFQRRRGHRALRLWVRWMRLWKWPRVSSLQLEQAAVFILNSRLR